MLLPPISPVRGPVGNPVLSPAGGLAVINTVDAWYDPTTFLGGNPVTAWRNRGDRGAAFDYNVPVGTAANLSTLDSGVALFPSGTSGDFLSTPASASTKQTGSITLIIWCVAFDWSPSSLQILGGVWDVVGSDRAYQWIINTNGTISLFISANGSTSALATSTVATGFTDGTGHWLRATWDDSADVANLYTSNDALNTASDSISWTQLGDADLALAQAGINASAANLEVGSANGGLNTFAGKIGRALLISGTDPTASPVVNSNPAEADSGVSIDTDTWISATSEVWTVNGDAFVNNTGFTGVYSRGGVVLETTAGQNLISPVTIYDVFHCTLAAPGADQYMFDARSNAAASMSLRTDESNLDKYTINQGSDISLAQAFANGLQVYTSQFLGTASSKLTAAAGSVTGNAGSENYDFGSIFGALGGGSTMQGLYLERLVFNADHSVAQIADIQNLLGARYA